MSEVLSNIKTRRSVRKYKPDLVPKDVIEQVYSNLNLDINIRGEKLSIEDYGMLSEELLSVSKN